MSLRYFYVNLSIFILSFLFIKESRAQSYGLGFFSHETESGKRTTLDLFPGTGFEARQNFELSFEISFFPEQHSYFGYIFRLENPVKNISFLHSRSGFVPNPEDPHFFKLVNGENPSNIGFNIEKEQIVSQWNKIKLVVDFDQDQLICYVNNKKYVEKKAQLLKGTYKFIWGINAKNSDCPPMKIRNIRLNNGSTSYFWPLNEVSGGVVHELNEGQNASVTNPSWIRAMHRNWQFKKDITVRGKASIAFNQRAGELYVVSPDSITTYQFGNSKTTSSLYRSGRQRLPLSNQSIYNEHDGKLYNYYIDREFKQINTYDFKKKEWDKHFPEFIVTVDYQNANNFFSAADSSLYIIGGYGHFVYKNTVYRYNTGGRKLIEIKTSGDHFSPRYLAAAGVADSGRTAYILGGYGSNTGKQFVNPKNLYDLMRFDIKSKTFKKIYDLDIKDEDFAFASSMVINEKTRTFNSLIFPNNRFNSYLRILQGHLDKPDYQLIGDSIPYRFHDVKGAANLYYNPKTKEYVAVTQFTADNDETTVSIYTLSDPPDGSPADEYVKNNSSDHSLILYALAGIAAAAAITWYLTRKKKPVVTETAPAPDTAPALAIPINGEPEATQKNAIFLFGGMQLINHEGKDIAKQFTSLLRELFLIILIYSLRSARGISGEKLAELLWPDKSESSAKNNRDANLSRLKGMLNQANNVSLFKEAGNWKINIDPSVIYFDYYHYLQIIANRKKIGREKICLLLNISERGNFLSGFEYQWLDQLKSEISNEIINIYLEYAESIKVQDDPEFLIKMANNIFYLDSVNEEAMTIKCKALSYLGKHSLAKSTFENFTKEFKQLYGEDFRKDFHTILGS